MRKEWNDKEEQYLLKKYTSQPVKITAKKLNRSITSVKHKARKLGINMHKDCLNPTVVAKCFKTYYEVVIRWIDKYGLPAKELKFKDKRKYEIDIEDFWEWAYRNKELINWNKYEKLSLLPEPQWVEDIIKNNNIPKKSREKFSNEEIRRIKVMLKKGYTYREIALNAERSYNSICHLCRKIYK